MIIRDLLADGITYIARAGRTLTTEKRGVVHDVLVVYGGLLGREVLYAGTDEAEAIRIFLAC